MESKTSLILVSTNYGHFCYFDVFPYLVLIILLIYFCVLRRNSDCFVNLWLLSPVVAPFLAPIFVERFDFAKSGTVRGHNVRCC